MLQCEKHNGYDGKSDAYPEDATCSDCLAAYASHHSWLKNSIKNVLDVIDKATPKLENEQKELNSVPMQKT